ncbi:extensin family protein [Hyphomicrobium sp. CS1BSMeth3]|uniref:extensin-like domain-containing protein n=1 Tax=Hyphomicrobium sp. CS1BSMeth3 TaxID=1892844 RepID=UPI0009FAAFCC|nr:extensin family protein [Hyphomicrobium sp. CS1BSMeth3]
MDAENKSDKQSAPSRGQGRRAPRVRAILLLVLVAASIFVVMRQGLLPARWSPLPALDLSVPNAWFVDWRIAELKRDRELCTRVLRGPVISASPVRDNPIKDGCGWENAMRISSAGGASLSVGTVSCEVAAGIAMWMAHEVQPRAVEIFGSRVTSVQHMGTYACRNVLGRKMWTDVRSEHATANALDISAFTLASGRQISVVRHWSGSGAEARFLREIHSAACRYFRVAIGPEFNALHRDHFHYDRGFLSRCK